MYLTPTHDFPTPHPRVQTALYTALECLRVAAEKFDLAMEEYDYDALRAARREQILRASAESRREMSDFDFNLNLHYDHLVASACTCRFFACVIEEIATGIPSISDQVLDAIRDMANEAGSCDPEHLHGGMLAMCAARMHLGEAERLSRQLDGAEITADYGLIVAAHEAVRSGLALLEGVSLGTVKNVEDTLDALLTKQRCTA